MFNFFTSIFSFIEMAFNFLLSMVKGLVDLVISLAAASVYLVECIAFLPVPIAAAGTAIVGVCVIYMVLGRN